MYEVKRIFLTEFQAWIKLSTRHEKISKFIVSQKF